MISAALFIFIGVQIGAPAWYYVLVGCGVLCNFLRTIINLMRQE